MTLLNNFSQLDQSIPARGGVVRIPFLPYTKSVSGSDLAFTDWSIDEGGAVWIANTGQTAIRFPVPHYARCKIASITALLAPDVGPRAGLPAGMPSLALQGFSISGVAGTLMSQADTSGNVTAYETIHAVTVVVPSNEGFLDSQTFQATFTRESGANSEFGLKITKLYVTLVPSRLLF